MAMSLKLGLRQVLDVYYVIMRWEERKVISTGVSELRMRRHHTNMGRLMSLTTASEYV